jgi:hypothetical protein
MPNQDVYTLKPGKNYTRFEKDADGKMIKIKVKPGDPFVPSDLELKSFRDLFTPVPKKAVDNDDFVITIKNGKKMEPEKLKKKLQSEVDKILITKDPPKELGGEGNTKPPQD